MASRFLPFALTTVLAACGLEVVGTGSGGSVGMGADAGVSLPNGDASSSGSVGDAGGGDATVDSGPRAVEASHTAETFDVTASALAGVTAIDTTALSVTGPATAPRFEDHGGNAVLYVGAWTVDVPIRITGTRKLIVLAAGVVKVDALVDAGARGGVAGPGGFGPGAGPGKGGDGVHFGADDSTGGGGGSFGGLGAGGGNVGGTFGGAPGSTYAPTKDDLFAGSGGGRGGDACPGDVGGAGGGAVQITSAVSITIETTGGVNVGGGGGAGGCKFVASAESAAGAGGGSGGLVFLEAPAITQKGPVSANGGGGGSGSNYNASIDGVPGADGAVGVALGGVEPSTSPGGNGATGSTAAVRPTQVVANNAGGGGGGVGRVWLRTRGAPPVTTAGAISPAPMLDTSL